MKAPSPARGVASTFEYWFLRYRRSWRGTVVSAFLLPVLYLSALGLGVGTLVDRAGTGPAGEAGYLGFVGPGLLAAGALQIAAAEGTHPVLAALRWNKAYHTMIGAPIGVTSLVTGHLAFIAVRVLMAAVVFTVVMVAFGAASSPLVVLAVPVAVLVGLACAPGIVAYTLWVDNDASLTVLLRFVVLPMVLFCGTFTPVAVLPDAVQPVIYCTPLYHGAQLCRELATGAVRLGSAAGHVAVLLAWAGVGFLLAVTVCRRRLVR
ncbi:lipooligosaccharide transport system permease protein [Krasilnikovia cinnamomea]|uniref:Transport permease protein n=1 Tax=Krasilnikovia cinnamomea TaxID=349313 RepID=A0A4Q7ZM11_9ACTN|nr:ABC transporter permease [Krasilnikovia cinnamomea]RZU51654.1 lipooligosaccharide transport system permease protein [Krasilnikovia cinnamomea]